MKKNEHRLDELFESARSEKPKLSFDQAKSNLLGTLTTGTAVGVAKLWAGLSTPLKGLIMLSTLGIITLTTVLIVGEKTPVLPDETIQETEQTTVLPNNEKEPSTEIIEVISNDSATTYRKFENGVWEYGDTTVDALLPIEDLPVEMIREDTTILEHAVAKSDEQPQEEVSPELVRFTISNSTTNEELDEIQRKAEAAGIRFSYFTKRKRNGKIRKAQVCLKIEIPEGKRCSSSTTLTGLFKYTFGWEQDNHGRAIDFWQP